MILMINKMKTGKHAGQFQVRIQPINKITGKRESWPVDYAKTKRAAKAMERKMWADYENGLQLAASNDSFVHSLSRYIDSRKGTISEVTQNDWDYTLRVCRHYFGNAQIRDINQNVMRQFAYEFVNDHHSTVSKNSVITRRLTHIRGFFKSLEGKVIKENPVPEKFLERFFQKKDIVIPKQTYLFSDDELKAIKALIQSELLKSDIRNKVSKLAIWIELETGMRPEELQALRYTDLTSKNDHSVFRIHDSWSDKFHHFNGALKSRSQGEFRYCLPLSPELADSISKYSKDQQKFLAIHHISNPEHLILLNIHDYKSAVNCYPICQRSMNLMVKQICNDLEIKSNKNRISMYSFRHTICTKLANEPRMSYPWAAARMGHSVEMFMNKYVSVDADVDYKMDEIWSDNYAH